MISILIPVYNRDVNQLASTLSNQLSAMDQPGEIVLLDDGSAEAFRKANAATVKLPHVKYMESEKNVGRIRIRQLLAEMAAYDWMLFLDGDSMIISARFLEKYYDEVVSYAAYSLLEGFPGLFVGGRIYQQQPPGNCSLRLHWEYGRKREAIDPQKRNTDPYRGFMSNNFMINKFYFERLSFTNDWDGYGHEDSWIGMQLEDYKTVIKYIDNAVLHDGLEPAETFIAKSEEALKNLHKLQKLVDNQQLKTHIRLFRVYAQLKSLGLLWLPATIYNLQKRKIEKNLRSCHPSLYYFDLYRLHRFIQITRST
jgi:glycosyltransferase involved in cell wall biosynthesis